MIGTQNELCSVNVCGYKHDFPLKCKWKISLVALAVKRVYFFTLVKDICFGRSPTQLRSALQYELTIC